MTTIISNNTFIVTDHTTGTGAGTGAFNIAQGGAFVGQLGSGTHNALVTRNVFDQVMHAAGGIGQLSMTFGGGTSQVEFTNNIFDKPWDGFVQISADGGAGTVLSENNTYIGGFVSDGDAGVVCGTTPGCQTPFNPYFIQVRNSGTLNLTLNNETIPDNDDISGFMHGFRAEAQASANTFCLNLTNNGSESGYELIQAGGTFNLQRGAAGAGDPPGGAGGILDDNNNTGGGGNAATNPPNVVTVGTITNFAGTCAVPTGGPFLQASTGENSAFTIVPHIVANALPNVVEEAIARWSETGISDEDIARLENANVDITDLPEGIVGMVFGNTVQVDVTGAGYGWFVDTTPEDDVEFFIPITDTERQALDHSPAYQQMDLLTVILHEFGHILGLPDLDADEHSHVLMADDLTTGTRRLPTGEGLVNFGRAVYYGHPLTAIGHPKTQLIPVSIPIGEGESGNASVAAQLVRFDIGTIRAGQTVEFVYEVVISNPLPTGATQISNQYELRCDNCNPLLSDDPSRGGLRDATITPIGFTNNRVPVADGTTIVASGTTSPYVQKSVNTTLASVGETLTYTISISNPKSITLTEVVVTDDFPVELENITFISSSVGQGAVSGRRLTVSGFELPPGGSGIITVRATVAQGLPAGTRILNTAILESPNASVHYSQPTTTLILPGVLPATGEREQSPMSYLIPLGVALVLGSCLYIRRRQLLV